MQVIVNGNIEQELVDRLVAEEIARRGKKIAKIVLTDCGDEVEVRTYEESPIRRIRRITGYLAPTDRWNPGKLAELRDRLAGGRRVSVREGAEKTGVLLRLHGVVQESVVDGPGLRDVVFVQGCPHRCPGCQNPGSWDFDGGSLVDVADVVSLLPTSPLVSGVTFSGGEPFCQAKALVEVARHVKSLGLNLWVYTGYTWEELLALPDPAARELLSLVDVLVDGRYVREERDISLPYRNSRNQRLIDARASLKAGEVIIWEPDLLNEIPPRTFRKEAV